MNSESIDYNYEKRRDLVLQVIRNLSHQNPGAYHSSDCIGFECYASVVFELKRDNKTPKKEVIDNIERIFSNENLSTLLEDLSQEIESVTVVGVSEVISAYRAKTAQNPPNPQPTQTP